MIRRSLSFVLALLVIPGLGVPAIVAAPTTYEEDYDCDDAKLAGQEANTTVRHVKATVPRALAVRVQVFGIDPSVSADVGARRTKQLRLRRQAPDDDPAAHLGQSSLSS